MLITSKVDKNKYKNIILKNGIKILLISNENYTKSSCCLSVRVGSYDEPVEYPGLAHFLEHMLFMGTEKYPNENEYSEYLASHSGSSNAYTDSEMTVYYFDVDSNYLEGAADRFAQFFTCPLLAKGSVERELLAVNSEYLNSLNSHAWRAHRITQELMIQELPESRFNCGNLETLQKENILEAVKKFEKDFYSSDLMSLVICGKESLDDLERIAHFFDNVKNINRKEQVDSKMKNETKILFRDEFYSKIVHFEPLDEKKSLSIIFTLPRLREKFKKNPLEYIDFLLTSKEPNRLLAKLKREKLAIDMSFSYEHYLENTVVDVNIELTDLGSKEHTRVLDMLASYISNMTAEESEYKRLGKIRSEEFSFTQTECPIDFTVRLCPNLHYYPIENILNFAYCFEEFDNELISDTIRRASDVSKWIILLSDKEGTFDKMEDLYKVKYTVLSSYSPKLIDVTKVKNTVEDEFLDKIDLLESEPKRRYKFEKFKNGEIHQVFECQFEVPKTVLFIDLKGPEIQKNLLSTHLFFNLAEEYFTESYARQLSNFHLDISVNTSPSGVLIKFEGFSSKILEMAKRFFKILESLSLDKFEIIKKEIEDYYSSRIKNSPYRRTIEIFNSEFFSSKRSEDLLEELKTLKKSQVKKPNNFYLKVLAVGNLEWEDLKNFYNEIKVEGNGYQFNSADLSKEYSFTTFDKNNNAIALLFNMNQCTDIPEPKINYEIEKNENLDLLMGHEYRYNTCIGNLIHQIAQEPFFNQLRTIEQLGYVVACSVRSFYSAQYLYFIVQSEKSVEFLEKRISEFISFLLDNIREMKEDDFNTFKESLACSFEEPFQNLEDYSGFCYSQLQTGSLDLNLGSKMAELVMSLTKDDILNSNILDSYIKVFSERKETEEIE